MKLSHAIILIALLTSQFASLAFGSAIVNGLCQFDKSTMIKEKLKKGQSASIMGITQEQRIILMAF